LGRGRLPAIGGCIAAAERFSEIKTRPERELTARVRGINLTKTGGIDVQVGIPENRVVQYIHHIRAKFEIPVFGDPYPFVYVHVELKTRWPIDHTKAKTANFTGCRVN
jgi:hypothetical protein